jgi:hypothetical protein
VADASLDGQTATFAFDDISKLSLSLSQMLTGSMDNKRGALKELSGGDDNIGVKFTREGAQSVLVLTMPELNDEEAQKAAQAAQAAGEKKTDKPLDVDAVPPEVMKMVQEMFKGFIIEVALAVDGTIVSTNAPFVDGSKVTLLEMNFEEIMKNMKKLQELMGKLEDTPDSLEQMLKLPGLKVATENEIRIVFKGRG